MDGRDRQAGSGRTGQKAARGDRLAAALRENLRRRKAQARARLGDEDRSGHTGGERPACDGPADDKTGSETGSGTGDNG